MLDKLLYGKLEWEYRKKHGVEVMNSQLLKSARVSKGKSQRDMAKVIGKSFSCYEKNENGTTLFTPDEIALVVIELELTFDQMNDIFFKSKLPFSK